MTDEALGVAQWAAHEGQHLDPGQDPDQGAQTRAQGGPTHDVARTGQQSDRGRRGGETEQAGQGQAPVGCARLGQHAPERAGGRGAHLRRDGSIRLERRHRAAAA